MPLACPQKNLRHCKMLKMWKAIGVLLLVSLLTGCSNGAVTARLSQIDSVMTDHPDSALALLDSLKTEKAGWPKSQRMRYDLLTAKAQNKAYVDFTTDSVMQQVAAYYDSHGTANDRVLAHYLLGCTYRDMGEAPRAVNSFMDAIAAADTTDNDFDFYTLSSVYSQLADTYDLQLLLSDEIKARQQASKFAFRANRPYWGIYNLHLSVGAYILLNKLDSAEILQKQVIKLYQDYGYQQAALRSSRTLIHLYVESSDRLSEAKSLMDIFESKYDKFDENHNLPPSERQYFYYKGRYFEKTGQLDSAELYYKKIYESGMPLFLKEPMFKGLFNVFTKRHQPDSIAKYAQLFCEANDSSVTRKDQELTAQMAANYRYQRLQKEAMKHEAEAFRAKVSVILLIFALIAVACVALFRRKVYLDKQRKMQKEYSNAIITYQDNLRSLEMLETARKATIETIQQELGDAHKAMANINEQYENSKAELMEENETLKRKITELERQSPVAKQLEHTKEFKETDIVKRIFDLLDHPTISLSDDELDSLTKTVSLFYPPLIHDLTQAKDISVLGRRVCMLAILNLRPGDIANLLDLSSQQVSNLRLSLNHSLFGEETARTLYKNLVQRYGIYTS